MKLLSPYSYVYIFIFLLGIIPPLPQISGYTHWVVTQHGMIEPMTTSYYHLRQSWNLVKLIRQEENWNFIRKIELKLNKVSNDLQINQEYQNKVQKHYVDSDSACVKANKLLSEFDLYSTHILTLETKGISTMVYLNEKLINENPHHILLTQPFCEQTFHRNFSMCCFEHLEAIQNRSSFEGVPEISLYKIALPQHLTPSEYGHLVALSLAESHKDPSRNWILYNMAAFYWRVKGAAKNAIDCIRAALHTSPHEFQDIAMVSLVNVLHLIKAAMTDAVVLMKNAISISPHFTSHHMILGNIYAILGQFNESLHQYELAARIHVPGRDKIQLQDIQDRIFAARCSYELSTAISIQQKKLDKQLEELESFQTETVRYQEIKSSLLQLGATNATQRSRQVAYEAFVRAERARMSLADYCDTENSLSHQEPGCQSSEERLLKSVFPDLSDLTKKSRQLAKASKTARGSETHHKDLRFMSRTPELEINESICQIIECLEIDNSINSSYGNQHLSIHLSPRSKGFDINDLLTDKQGLDRNREHPLPWYPPYCRAYVNRSDLVPVKVVDMLESLNLKHLMDQHDHSDSSKDADSTLVEKLLHFVNGKNVRLEDIGQRIVTAMKKRLVPHWIVFNIAALYWRVVGNLIDALECQKLSAKLSPSQYRDVSLVNLAVILARLNRNFDALKLVKAALLVDSTEPETHIVAASLYNEQQQFRLAHHHLAIAFKQNPNFRLRGFDLNFFTCHLCKKYLEANSSRQFQQSDKEWQQLFTQIFIKHNMCLSPTECANIFGKNYRFIPHIKVTLKGPTFSSMEIEQLATDDLDSINEHISKSHIMYGILWNTNLSNLHIQDHDCLITNDSILSIGCSTNDQIFSASQNAINFLAELKQFIDNPSKHVPGNTSVKELVEKNSGHNDDRSTNTQLEVLKHPTLKMTTADIQETIVNFISFKAVMQPLTPKDCERVAPFDFKTYTPLYVSLNTMHINIISLLDSLVPGYSFSFNRQPYCVPMGKNFLRQVIEKYQIDLESSSQSKTPEHNLLASFLKTFDDKFTLEDVSRRLFTGLEQNATDWRLATIAVNYWRVSGDASQAFKCLELAIENCPDFHEEVLLVNAANILYRISKLEAALEISHRSLQYSNSQNWIVIPFLVANIFAAMGKWQKAILFYEACLSLKNDFEEAIYRIKSIQCQQMMLRNLEQH